MRKTQKINKRQATVKRMEPKDQFCQLYKIAVFNFGKMPHHQRQFCRHCLETRRE